MGVRMIDVEKSLKRPNSTVTGNPRTKTDKIYNFSEHREYRFGSLYRIIPSESERYGLSVSLYPSTSMKSFKAVKRVVRLFIPHSAKRFPDFGF